MAQAQLAKRIRQLARDSSNVFLTDHVKKQMAQRKVSHAEVVECLRCGTITRVPEISDDMESLECRMERYVAGRDLTVVAAICEEDPDVVVVTVFSSGNQH